MKTDAVGVITYNIAHRKTYDTLCLLKACGYEKVVVFAKPLHYEKKITPLVKHRPKPYVDLPLDILCKSFGYDYVDIADYLQSELPGSTPILICGAGIVPQELINNYTIINAHPGYLPNVRGLDALKWAVYENQPIGVTTHILGDEVDAGDIIDRQLVPIYFNDSFHAVAQRQYEMEVRMLVEALDKLQNVCEHMKPSNYPVHRRMQHSFEMRLFECFEKIRQSVGIDA